jgi:hypothetical protein
MDIDNERLQFYGVTFLSLLNFGVLLFQTMRKLPQEVAKMKAEKAESIAEAAESNMQGAQISNDLLMKRLEEERKEKRNWRTYAEALEKELLNNGYAVPKFDPLDTEPKIKPIKRK